MGVKRTKTKMRNIVQMKTIQNNCGTDLYKNTLKINIVFHFKFICNKYMHKVHKTGTYSKLALCSILEDNLYKYLQLHVATFRKSR